MTVKITGFLVGSTVLMCRLKFNLSDKRKLSTFVLLKILLDSIGLVSNGVSSVVIQRNARKRVFGQIGATRMRQK